MMIVQEAGPRRKDAVMALAERVRQALNLGDRILDIEQAVERLGGTVEIMAQTGSQAAAEIDRLGDRQFRIRLSRELPDPHYSTAHMLGHVFLDMGYLDASMWGKQTTYRDSVVYRAGHSIEERDANWFAGALLMPREAFRQVVEQNRLVTPAGTPGQFNLDGIASAFGVSTQVAELRGQVLGIFG